MAEHCLHILFVGPAHPADIGVKYKDRQTPGRWRDKEFCMQKSFQFQDCNKCRKKMLAAITACSLWIREMNAES